MQKKIMGIDEGLMWLIQHGLVFFLAGVVFCIFVPIKVGMPIVAIIATITIVNSIILTPSALRGLKNGRKNR